MTMANSTAGKENQLTTEPIHPIAQGGPKGPRRREIDSPSHSIGKGDLVGLLVWKCRLCRGTFDEKEAFSHHLVEEHSYKHITTDGRRAFGRGPGYDG